MKPNNRAILLILLILMKPNIWKLLCILLLAALVIVHIQSTRTIKQQDKAIDALIETLNETNQPAPKPKPSGMFRPNDIII